MRHKAVIASSAEFRLNDECREWLRVHGLSEDEIENYMKGNVPRHDPLLVQCVEEVKKGGPYFKGYSNAGYYNNLEVDVVNFDSDKYIIMELVYGEDLITANNPLFGDLSEGRIINCIK